MTSFKTQLLIPMFVLCFAANIFATWSVSAVDRNSGDVGIAGASCTFNVQGIGEAIPGKGVVVVQAMSNDDARAAGMDALRKGISPSEIVSLLKDTKYKFEEQQYAIVSLQNDAPPAVYSGKDTSNWKGAIVSDNATFQGNILVSEQVLVKAKAAFEKSSAQRLEQKLISSLKAGADAGGDKRCGKQTARSAFVTVYSKKDNPRWPRFHLVVYGIEKGGENAVARLQTEFRKLLKRSKKNKSTRVYIQP